MDEYDFRITDKQMSERMNLIYGNPKRHRFVSQFELDEDQDLRGPRGGKTKGRKRICGHCGCKEKGHASKDEQL